MKLKAWTNNSMKKKCFINSVDENGWWRKQALGAGLNGSTLRYFKICSVGVVLFIIVWWCGSYLFSELQIQSKVLGWAYSINLSLLKSQGLVVTLPSPLLSSLPWIFSCLTERLVHKPVLLDSETVVSKPSFYIHLLPKLSKHSSIIE